MNEHHQISGVDIRTATIPQAIDALSTGKVKRFILISDETAPNTQGRESVVVLCDQILPREIVFELMEKLLQRPPGTLEDNSLGNN
jgi:hypothetical protein